MKSAIKENVIQLVLIVFSVVLGLYLSERIEEEKNKKEARLLLSKIRSEVDGNKKILEYWIPYHRAIVNRLDSLIEDERFIQAFIDDESVLGKKVLTRGNLMGELPSDAAWDIAKSHPLIVHFEYDDLFTLTRIYNQQEDSFKPLDRMLEMFLSSDFNSADNAKLNLQGFENQMSEMLSREEQLLHYIQVSEENLSHKY